MQCDRYDHMFINLGEKRQQKYFLSSSPPPLTKSLHSQGSGVEREANCGFGISAVLIAVIPSVMRP